MHDPSGTRLVTCSWNGSIGVSDIVPLPKRLQQAKRSRATEQQVAPLVEQMLDGDMTASEIAEKIRANAALSGETRRAALNVLLTRVAVRDGSVPMK